MADRKGVSEMFVFWHGPALERIGIATSLESLRLTKKETGGVDFKSARVEVPECECEQWKEVADYRSQCISIVDEYLRIDRGIMSLIDYIRAGMDDLKRRNEKMVEYWRLLFIKERELFEHASYGSSKEQLCKEPELSAYPQFECGWGGCLRPVSFRGERCDEHVEVVKRTEPVATSDLKKENGDV